jgi:hypothetical protein
MSCNVTEIGVRIVDVRAETADDHGILLPEYIRLFVPSALVQQRA